MNIERKGDSAFAQRGPMDDILTFYECEMIVEQIIPIDLKEYGSSKYTSIFPQL